jgi:hypothetical protein
MDKKGDQSAGVPKYRVPLESTNHDTKRVAQQKASISMYGKMTTQAVQKVMMHLKRATGKR